MNKSLSIVNLLTVLLFAVSAIAADKVVVVPLGGKKCTSPTENSFTNTNGMTFNLIPAGTFTMGSPVTEPGRETEEIQHQVTLTKSFYMQTTEVTQKQWEDLIGNNKVWGNAGDNYPRDYVNWYEAVYFANALSQSEGRSKCYTLNGCDSTEPGFHMVCSSVTINTGCKGYRLPTEAEWEYAARAGTTTAYANPVSFDATNEVIDNTFNSNLAAMGWYSWNSTNGYVAGTKPVAQKQANRWGLYDMHGNLSEWCQDWYDADYFTDPNSSTNPQGPAGGTYRVIRGGHFFGWAKYERSADRDYQQPDESYHSMQGFRLVLPSSH